MMLRPVLTRSSFHRFRSCAWPRLCPPTHAVRWAACARLRGRRQIGDNARTARGVDPAQGGVIMRSKLLVAMTAAAMLILPIGASSAAISATHTRAQSAADVAPAIPGTSSNFELIGHNSLFNRGMNAAAAIFGNYMYVGNRTDASNTCPDGTTTCPHPHPGILILNIADPANPTVVGEIGPPFAGNVGITTRELRVWPQKKLLVVMTFRVSNAIEYFAPETDSTLRINNYCVNLSFLEHVRIIENN